MNWLRLVRLLPVLAIVGCGDATTEPGPIAHNSGPSSPEGDAGVTEVTPPTTEEFVVTRVSLFQSLEIPLYPEKDLATVPLIAGKDTLVRVNVRPANGATKLENVFATVQLDDGASAPIAGPPVEVAAASDTVLDVTIPASQLTSSAKLRVQVMPEAASTTSGGSIGAWPREARPSRWRPKYPATCVWWSCR